MDKKVSEMSKEELDSLVNEVKENLSKQGIRFKKTKYVRKKNPWQR